MIGGRGANACDFERGSGRGERINWLRSVRMVVMMVMMMEGVAKGDGKGGFAQYSSHVIDANGGISGA